MLQFAPAATDHATQPNAVLEPVTHLVQAMRGFICRFTVVLYGYCQVELLAASRSHPGGALGDQPTSRWFMDHVFIQSVALNLRSMVEDKKISLGAGAIAHGLSDPAARAGLCSYLDTCAPERRTTDAAKRDKYLDYILKYTSLLATRPKLGETVPPLVAKAELIRRWANKAIAHLTLDHYDVHGNDLRDLVLANAFVATAIERVMGDAGSDTDLVVCEQMSLTNGKTLFGTSASHAAFMPDVRSILEICLQTAKEFPFT